MTCEVISSSDYQPICMFDANWLKMRMNIFYIEVKIVTFNNFPIDSVSLLQS